MNIPKNNIILPRGNFKAKRLKIVRNWVNNENKMNSIVSTSTILVNDFKNSLWHTQQERLQEVFQNVSPGGEQLKLGGEHPQS